MITITPMTSPTNMVLSVRKVPSEAGATFLAANEPARARAGIMTPNLPTSMSMAPMTL